VAGVLFTGLLGLLVVLLVRSFGCAPRRRLRVASALTLAAQLGACGAGPVSLGSSSSALTGAETVHYFHTGVSAGPALITRADGTVAEERRFEPFGAPISADLATDPTNSLGKPTDRATGWSYHGARWMAPETGRWMSPDPLVKAPDPAFLESPWRLNPYAYGEQDPVRFWDPDGKDAVPVSDYGVRLKDSRMKLELDKDLFKLDLSARAAESGMGNAGYAMYMQKKGVEMAKMLIDIITPDDLFGLTGGELGAHIGGEHAHGDISFEGMLVAGYNAEDGAYAGTLYGVVQGFEAFGLKIAGGDLAEKLYLGGDPHDTGLTVHVEEASFMNFGAGLWTSNHGDTGFYIFGPAPWNEAGFVGGGVGWNDPQRHTGGSWSADRPRITSHAVPPAKK
jgi:RHS repeat-associated protein